MSKKLILLMVLLLIVPMALAACGDDDKDDKKDENKGAAELSQSFTSATGITVKYPEGWVAEDGSSGLQIANSQASMDAMNAGDNGEIPEGAAAAIGMALPLAQMGLPEGTTIKDILTMMGTSMTGEGATMGEVEELKVGGKDAAKASMKDDGTKSDGFVVAIMLDDATALIVVGIAHTGELGSVEETMMKIAESMTYTAPAG